LGLLIQPIEAFARDHHHGGGHYHYRGDRWYRSDWFWFDVGLAALAIGALVDALPPGHTTVVVGGLPYYYYNNIYYRPYYPSGYIVVPAPAAPAVVVPAPPQRGETVVINVPNRDGTYTPVTLVRWGDGYVGPQGEYYAGHPTVEQLRVLYGR
jgi:hypothetical protein